MGHPINDFFDKVFVIAIERNEERLKAFISNNPNLEVEVFWGVDGKELFPSIEYVGDFPADFFRANHLNYERCLSLNKSQVGCAMSNLFVQKEIVKRGLKRVLILEDDAYLVAKELPGFQRAIKELPLDWELFYLGFRQPSKWAQHPFTRFFTRIKYWMKPTVIVGMSSANFRKRFFTGWFSRHLNIPGVYIGTHAYALSYEGAKKIVAIDTPLKYGADIALMYANYHKLINGYSLKHQLFIPNPIFETSLIN
ncbi:MAG: glycosyltransferase family 25 protein [Ferruginibacter sp.]